MPDSVAFACPGCKAAIRMRTVYSGRVVACPRCKAPMRVPPPALDDPEVLPDRRPPRHEDDGYYEPPPQASRITMFRRVMWFIFFGWTILKIVSHTAGMAVQNSAPQQAAFAGDTCAWLIAGYLLARALDKALLTWRE